MSYEVNRMLEKLPAYKGRRKLLKMRQHTGDIIHAIMSLHPKMMDHYDRIAGDLWTGDVPGTARAIYSFVKRHLPYQEEKELSQTVKTPAAILAERYEFGNDCKHFASMIVGLGEALRRAGKPVKCFYRFASYKPGSRSPGHVFAVFVDKGKEIWVDPVPQIPGFDSRKIMPAMTIDKMPPMSRNGNRIGSLYEISGVGNVQPLPGSVTLGGLQSRTLGNCHWLDRAGGSMPAHAHHRHGLGHWRDHMGGAGHWMDETMGKAKKHHKFRIRVPHIKIEPGKLLKKAMGAPSRNAFLLLVKLNTFHLATKMWTKAAHDKNSANWKKLAHAWANMGGKPEKLYKEIKRGVNTYNKLHKAKKHIAVSGFDSFLADNGYHTDDIIHGVEDNDVSMEYMGAPYHDLMYPHDILTMISANHHGRCNRIGVAQAAGAAAIIAAAAPILAALGNILRSFGVDTKKAKETSDKADQELADAHNNGTVNEDGSVTHDDGTVTKVVNNADGTQTIQVKKAAGLDDKEQEAADGDDDGTSKTVTKTKTKTVTKTTDEDGGDGGTGAGFMSKINDFVNAHKTGLAMTVGGGVLLGLSVSKSAKKMGMMQPIMGIGGGALLVMGAVQLFKK